MARISRKNQPASTSSATAYGSTHPSDTRCLSTNTKWICGAYTRISVEKGDSESGTLKTQAEIIQKFVEGMPSASLYRTYSDNGYSGTNFNRPAFNELMEDIRQGNINCVIVKDLSRFGRNHLDTGMYLEHIFPTLGVRFIAIGDQYDSNNATSSEASLITPVKNLINEAYARDISRKIKATLNTKTQKGERKITVAPFGYRKDPEDPTRLLIDKPAARVVQQIFSDYINGIGAYTIAHNLTSANIPTPSMIANIDGITKFKSWSAREVTLILKNDVYIGNLRFNKSTLSKFANGGKVKFHPEYEHALFEGVHEAIIDVDTFNRANAIIKSRSDKQATAQQKHQQQTNLTPNMIPVGLFRCAECGDRMQLIREKDNSTGHIRELVYACKGASKAHSSGKRPHVAEPYALIVIRDAIYEQAKAAEGCDSKDPTNEAKLQKVKLKELKNNLVKLNKEKESLETKLRKFYGDFASGALTQDEWVSAKMQTNTLLEGVKPKIEKVKDELEALEQLQLNATHNKTQNPTEIKIPDISTELIEATIDKILMHEEGSIEVKFKELTNQQFSETLARFAK